MRRVFNLLIATLISTTCLAQEINLRLDLEKGKEYNLTTSSKAKIVQQVSGQTVNMKISVGGTMVFLVTGVYDTYYSMDVRYDKLNMSMSMPQGNMDFSSEINNSNDVLSTVLSEMKGKVFKLNMSKSGKVSEVRNVELLWESAINTFPDMTKAQKDQVVEQVAKSFGEDAIKGNIEMVTSIYPEYKIKKGDKWNVETNLSSGVLAQMTTEYELISIENDIAFLKGSSVIQTEDNDKYMETNGMEMKYDMSGTMLTDLKVDKKSGWIIKATITQDLKGKAIIKANSQMPDGMEIPMTMLNEMTISNN